MPAPICLGRLANPAADHHIELFIEHPRDQAWGRCRIVGRIAIGHHIDVGIDIGEHAPHHRALALDPFGPHERPCRLRQRDGAVG